MINILISIIIFQLWDRAYLAPPVLSFHWISCWGLWILRWAILIFAFGSTKERFSLSPLWWIQISENLHSNNSCGPWIHRPMKDMVFFEAFLETYLALSLSSWRCDSQYTAVDVQGAHLSDQSHIWGRDTAFLICWKVIYNILIHSFKYVSCFRPFLQSNLVWLSKNHSSLYFWVDWPLYVLTFWKHISNGRPPLIGDKKPSAAWWTPKYWASC